MNVELALEKTETYLEQQKDHIPEEVYNYIFRICQEDKKYIQMVKSWQTESFSDKKKRMEQGWNADTI